MSGAKIDKLARMANQIAEFFAPMPETEAVSGVASHLRKFWTPKMIRELTEHALSDGAGLAPAVRAALLAAGEPPHVNSKPSPQDA